jgi:hypothetical protein
LQRSLASLLAVILLALGAGTASAGILLEADHAGQPLRLELGQDQTRVLATVAGSHYLVDVARGDVYALGSVPPRRLRAGAMPDPAPTPRFALERWSEGPVVAGNGSTYNVLIIDERICGEVLVSPWMAPFTDPLVRSIELLQRVDQRLAAPAREPCGRIGFGVYASNGFPLLAGFKDEPVFKVTQLRFDHRPLESLFVLPAETTDCGATRC